MKRIMLVLVVIAGCTLVTSGTAVADRDDPEGVPAPVVALAERLLSSEASWNEMTPKERALIDHYFRPSKSVVTYERANLPGPPTALLLSDCTWHTADRWYYASAGNLLWHWKVTTNFCFDGATVWAADSYGEDMNQTQWPWSYAGEQVDQTTYGPGNAYFGTYNKAKYHICLVYCPEVKLPWFYKNGYPDGWVSTAAGID